MCNVIDVKFEKLCTANPGYTTSALTILRQGSGLEVELGSNLHTIKWGR